MSAEKAVKKTSKSKAAPTHPPVKDMVVAAITDLKQRKGVSLIAIKKHVAANNLTVDPVRINRYILKCLKSGVETGFFVQLKGSYKIAKPDKKEKKPAESEKKAKKPAEKKTKKPAEKKTKKVAEKKTKSKSPKKPAAKKTPKEATKKPASKKSPKKAEKKPKAKATKKSPVKKAKK